jgi:hypothetical protein
MHGKDAIIEEVMDWEPYDHVTYRTLLPIPNVPKLLSTYLFEDLGDGRTRVELRFGRPRSAKDRAIAEPLMPMISGMFQAGAADLVPIVEAAARSAEMTAAPEPDVPASSGRNLREPIVGAGRER